MKKGWYRFDVYGRRKRVRNPFVIVFLRMGWLR